MYCRNCGKEIDPGAAICVGCGYQNGTGFNFCQNCGQQVTPGAAICTNCGYALTAPVVGEQKSKLVAVLLAFFLGSIGIHDFLPGLHQVRRYQDRPHLLHRRGWQHLGADRLHPPADRLPAHRRQRRGAEKGILIGFTKKDCGRLSTVFFYNITAMVSISAAF